MVYAIQQLLLNMKLADKNATLNPTEDTMEEPPLGGPSAHPVPTNMTALSNYIKGLNPKAFQSSQANQEQQEPARSGNTRRSPSSQARMYLDILR